MNKGYTIVEVAGVEVEEEEKKETKKSPSKLHPQVQELMKFIFDMNKITKSIEMTGYDPKKMPLGNLTDATIN